MYKLNKILIGSKNQAKIKEIKEGLFEIKNLGVEIFDLNDFDISEEPEENGQTIKENSLIKAKFYFEKIKIPTISDDSAFVIPYLNGEPGVKSRKWLGYDASDEELIEYTLFRMKDAKGEERTAYLVCNICFYDGFNNKIIFVEEKIKGYIAEKPSERRIPGYPFRSLFIVDGLNKYYDELTEDEHKNFNHRLRALEKLLLELKNYFND